MDTEDYIRRFDLYAALYVFLTAFHSGQGSRGYRMLSRLTRRYQPGRSVANGNFENNEQRRIYEVLCHNHSRNV